MNKMILATFSKVSSIFQKGKFVVLLIVLLIILLIVLLICIFLYNSREGLTSDDKEYFSDVLDKMTQIDNIYNDVSNGVKSEYTISNAYKKQKILNVINSMKDDKKGHTYKKDLKKIIDDVTITDDAKILDNIKNKVTIIISELNSDEIKNEMVKEIIEKLDNNFKNILQAINNNDKMKSDDVTKLNSIIIDGLSKHDFYGYIKKRVEDDMGTKKISDNYFVQNIFKDLKDQKPELKSYFEEFGNINQNMKEYIKNNKTITKDDTEMLLKLIDYFSNNIQKIK